MTFFTQNDKWLSTQGLILKYDKLEHLLFFGALTLLGDNWWMYATALNFGNEVKDVLLPWQKYGWIGGNGFSVKDFLAGCVGTVLAYLIRHFLFSSPSV